MKSSKHIDTYKKICLTLDDNKWDRLCTWKDDGSLDSRSRYTTPAGEIAEVANPGRYITFKRPTRNVKKITLSFPKGEDATIADLKIKYHAKPKPSQFALSEEYYYNENTNKFYKVYNDKQNWSNARAQCESDGAILAIPSSEEENKFIADLVSGPVWIGVTDIDEEGKYVGVDGSVLTYTNWEDNQPDNYNHQHGMDEDGVHIRDSEGKWNDQEVQNHKYQFVCSLAVKDEPSPEDYGLPKEYKFAQRVEGSRGQNGDFFFRRYTVGTGYETSRDRCENDGANLFIPENFADLQFIAQEMPFYLNIWLGINDIEEEGTFVRDDGLPLTYTNWDPESDDPDNWNGVTSEFEGANAVGVLTRDMWPQLFFHDVPDGQGYSSICIYNIKP